MHLGSCKYTQVKIVWASEHPCSHATTVCEVGVKSSQVKSSQVKLDGKVSLHGVALPTNYLYDDVVLKVPA
jgi:hypothetical protein